MKQPDMEETVQQIEVADKLIQLVAEYYESKQEKAEKGV